MDYETGKFLERIETKIDNIIILLGYDPQTLQQPTPSIAPTPEPMIDEEQLALDRETKEELRRQQEKIKAALNRRGGDDE